MIPDLPYHVVAAPSLRSWSQKEILHFTLWKMWIYCVKKFCLNSFGELFYNRMYAVYWKTGFKIFSIKVFPEALIGMSDVTSELCKMPKGNAGGNMCYYSRPITLQHRQLESINKQSKWHYCKNLLRLQFSHPTCPQYLAENW